MTDTPNVSMDPNEFMKRMKAIASDLWGGVAPEEEPSSVPEQRKELPTEPEKPKTDIQSLWKTADETIDWTDALAHSAPTDGLTGPRLWAFYHKHAQKVLAGDLTAYTEVLQKANPLGELTDFADNIRMQAQSPDRLESSFTCKSELLEQNRKLYPAAMALRIARDLLACLPVEEVAVTAENNGETIFSVTYTRQMLMHRNFVFTDPIALAKECGAEYK